MVLKIKKPVNKMSEWEKDLSGISVKRSSGVINHGCPRCRGSLMIEEEVWACINCGRVLEIENLPV